MCRHLPFSTRRVCIDCGASHNRHGRAWRCLGCADAVREVRAEAHRALGIEIRAGRIPPARTLHCHDCGRPAADYDHRDYSQPLKVTALCESCNAMRGPAMWRQPAGADRAAA